MRRMLIACIASLFILCSNTLSLADETYRGTIYHSPSGRHSDIYLRKSPTVNHKQFFDKGIMEDYEEIDRDFDRMMRWLNEDRKLKIEMEKLRLLRERNDLERRRLEQGSQKTRRTQKKPDQYKGQESSYSSKDYGRYDYNSDTQSVTQLRVVYFKNGKKLTCDHVWRDGNTVFVVAQGKKFAVGYDQIEIDMKKSFGIP